VRLWLTIALKLLQSGRRCGALRLDDLGRKGVTAAPRLASGARDPYVSGMKQLELTDGEAEALIQELSGTINYARYPLSPRIQTLREILSKLRPEPARPAAAPAPRVYEPPSKGRYRRRR
jgi:hypothetical protein